MHQPDIYSILASAVGRTIVLRGSTAPVKVASIRRAGAGVIVQGRSLAGRPVTFDVVSSTAVLPSWGIRLASVLRFAWEAPQFDPIVKELISQAGLPVDSKVDWDSKLRAIAREKGLAVGDNELQDDLIQEALVTLVWRRSIEKFDPAAPSVDGRDFSDQPLEEKVTAYVTQLFRWQFGSDVRRLLDRNYRDREQVQDLETEDPEGGSFSFMDSVAGDEDSPDDAYAQAQGSEHLQQLRSEFAAYLARHREGEIPSLVMVLFDLITAAPKSVDLKTLWEERTGKSYAAMRKALIVLKEEMAHFAAHKGRLGATDSDFLNDVRMRVLTPDTTPVEEVEDLTHTPEVVEEEEESAPQMGIKSSVGVKAAAMAQVLSDVKVNHTKAASFVASVGHEAWWATEKRAGLALHTEAKDAHTLQVRVGSARYTIESGSPEKVQKQLAVLAHHVTPRTASIVQTIQASVAEHAAAFANTPRDMRAGFKQAAELIHAATIEETPMSTNRFAALKKAAEENPEETAQSLEAIKQKLLEQAQLIENLQQHMDMTPEAEQKFAGFKKAAEEEPEEIEAALQQIFQGIDDVMADVEALADSNDIDLVPSEEGGEEEGAESEPAEEEEISSEDATAE